MTMEEISKAKESFPRYTVYMCYRCGRITAKTGTYYAEQGKTYQECTEALKKAIDGEFKERQDADLYAIVRENEQNKQLNIELEEFVDRLREISSDIDDLIYDADGD